MPYISYKPNVGQYGNQLFPTILACIFAQKYHLKLSIHANPLLRLDEHFENSHVVESINTDETFTHVDDPIHYLATHVVEAEENLQIARKYYQNASVFEDYKLTVCKYIMKPCMLPKNNKDIVMHVRLDGFNHNGHNSHILAPEFYTDILDNETYDRLFIVMATKSGRIWKKQQPHKEAYISHFDAYNPIIVSNDELTDFEFIRSFNKIICSNSTFAWWATFLSNAETIYMPKHFEGKHAKLTLSNAHVRNPIFIDIETMKRVPFSFL